MLDATMTRMNGTEQAEYLFKVKDIDAKRACIAAEPRSGGLPTFKKLDINIGFELKDESHGNAEMIADLLNKYLKNIRIW
jgi:hypothetical protein